MNGGSARREKMSAGYQSTSSGSRPRSSASLTAVPGASEVFRGGVVEHAKYAGRRIFGAGINQAITIQTFLYSLIGAVILLAIVNLVRRGSVR